MTAPRPRSQEEQLRHVKSDVEHFVRQVEVRLDQFEGEMEQVVAALNMLVRAHNPDVDDDDHTLQAKAMLDAIWECESCQSRLAVVDGKKDEMRIKYRNHMIYVTPGEGGSVSIICRKCGRLNTVKGEPVKGELVESEAAK